ncbi:MAG: TIGR00159 family protein [Planctomycetes bacterium]|nr:TIGR00159 family protein [Planctomycetota bacterium]
MKDILSVTSGIEIILIFIFFYYLLTSLQGTRGAGIFRGIIFGFVIVAVAVGLLAQFYQLTNISYISTWLVPFLIGVLLVVFQPELRRMLFNLGKSRLFNPFFKPKSGIIDEVIDAAVKLAEKKYGALMAIEREIGLKPYIEGGVKVDSEVTTELIQTIFYPGSELHDGAIVIKDERVTAARCLFPLTENPDIPKSVGTRHRAAIGITEESDAIAIVVSEETGQVSVCINGQLKPDLTKEALNNTLHELYLQK